ncbi:MAG: VCBS repeat-containing protein [candidate division Zixibacteria bacterium]|nr:VCBS repeat-containing protein [candidate division Zixibacteria bacterium]
MAASSVDGDVVVLKNKGNGDFSFPTFYWVGGLPDVAIAADLDGDEFPDLAVTRSATNRIAVLRNNGDGTFAHHVNYNAGRQPWSVCAADLNGDGNLDLAVTNLGYDSVSVLLNKGGAVLGAPVNYAAGSLPMSIIADDLDEDGDVDLATANKGSGNVSILISSGDGTFNLPVFYDAGDLPYAIIASDLDGDCSIDLAVGNQAELSAGVRVLRNIGDGTFAPPVIYAAGICPAIIAAADLDGDGVLDLAASNTCGKTVCLLRNSGNGTFGAPVAYISQGFPGTFSGALVSADFNLDGAQDLAVGGLRSGVSGVMLSCSLPYQIGIDILPHQCPNVITTDLTAALRPKQLPGGPGVTPTQEQLSVAILGTCSLKARQCNLSTVRLEGVLPQRWEFKDVGQPALPDEIECDCPLARADGFEDLVLYFDQGAVLNALRPWQDGDRRILHLVARMTSGTSLVGSDCLTIREVVTITPPRPELAGAVTPTSLHDCSPNPFNANTTVRYNLAESVPIKLEIFDILGRRLRTLADDFQQAGIHEITWDGTDAHGQAAASGMYFYRLSAGMYVKSKKMIMLK